MSDQIRGVSSKSSKIPAGIIEIRNSFRVYVFIASCSVESLSEKIPFMLPTRISVSFTAVLICVTASVEILVIAVWNCPVIVLLSSEYFLSSSIC